MPAVLVVLVVLAMPPPLVLPLLLAALLLCWSLCCVSLIAVAQAAFAAPPFVPSATPLVAAVPPAAAALVRRPSSPRAPAPSPLLLQLFARLFSLLAGSAARIVIWVWRRRPQKEHRVQTAQQARQPRCLSGGGQPQGQHLGVLPHGQAVGGCRGVAL